MDERGLSNKLRFKDEETIPGRTAPADISLADKPKARQNRLRFKEEEPQESALIADNNKSRLRFENEETPGSSLLAADTPLTSGQVVQCH